MNELKVVYAVFINDSIENNWNVSELDSLFTVRENADNRAAELTQEFYKDIESGHRSEWDMTKYSIKEVMLSD